SQMKVLRRSNGGKPVVISIENVDEFTEHVLHSRDSVLVYFWADSNGPSRMMGTRLEEKVASQGGSLLLVKVNIDYCGELALEWNVSVVPLIVEFKMGNEEMKLKGTVSDNELTSFIDKLTKS
ncbi:hypothetical protein PFISCL1PPCAC_2093, partial [Pristionchus fissidentatus]